MNKQEVFNRVRDHLLKQGAKSMMSRNDGVGDDCQYRGPNGLQCAVGCLITDEAFARGVEDERNFNSVAIYNWRVKQALRESGIEFGDYSNDLKLLSALQEVHDVHPVEQWPSLLRDVALRYGVDP